MRFGLAPALVIALFVLLSGCGSDSPAADESGASEQEDVAASGASIPDSIDVVDDERSLERRIDDAALATQVRIALVDARELRSYNFDPVAVNGRVVLRGEVNTQAERNRAEAVAREVSGVRDVRNEITAAEQPVTASEPDTAGQDQLAEGETSDSAADADSDQADDAEATADAADEQAAADEAETASDEAQEEETFHTVRSGESLWTISRQHGVSIDQIRRLNNLQGNNLRPGQRLRVK